MRHDTYHSLRMIVHWRMRAVSLWPLATDALNQWTLNVKVEELNAANQEPGLRDRLEIGSIG
jgi:hypothetical protein